jgi:hypothetical protein
VIEEIFHEKLGLVAARRSYVCMIESDGQIIRHMLLGTTGWLRAVASVLDIPHDREMYCAECDRGPMLWDSQHSLPYVLVPFVIHEEIQIHDIL